MVRASDAYIKSGAFRAEIVTRAATWREFRATRKRVVEKPVHASTARINFQLAFARRIAKRLGEAREQARRDVVAAERADATAQPGSTELVLREKEVELRDFYTATSSARGSWQGFRAQAGYSSHARRAGDRAARHARLGGEKELGGGRHALALREELAG